MTATRATFIGFDPYKLTGVRVTDRELGHGSYATVLELEYMGLKCAGKKIHELLLRQGDATYPVRRFEEECRLLSRVRHPNIVQFLGVHFQEGVRTPILVMEFLPTNLTSCIERYGILPKEISYSILHDIALGLCYLHNQTPAIIHRDLSSNNVLLTPNMTAKVSDLGVARILNLTPLQVSHMTQTPGTPAYMPPEVMVASPKYDTSVDVFSYGIMMIHMFSGHWPEPQIGPNRTEGGKLIPVTEAERRVVFFKAIESDHPLMDLIHNCINNDPQVRPHTIEIVRRVNEIATQFPSFFTDRLEMLQHIESVEEEKRTLIEEGERKDRIIQQNKVEIFHRDKEIRVEEQKSVEIKRVNVAHSSEVEQLRLQVNDLQVHNQLVIATMEAELTELKSQAAFYESQIESNSKVLIREREQSEEMLMKEREQSERQREISRRLMVDNHDLQSHLSKSMAECTTLQRSISKLEADIATKDNTIQMKDASVQRKDSEIEAKTRALEGKNATISALNEQLTKARELDAQVLQACITWKQCAELPGKLSNGKTTMINGKVYCGGGETDANIDDRYIVFCYDPSHDKWTTLPPLPVRWFGLGQVNGKLVAVGGQRRDGARTGKVYTYNERSQQWKQIIPPMPTARNSPGVLSLQSALVVVGGAAYSYYVAAVEIFKPDTSQWYRTDPLPKAPRDISLVTIGNMCYALGGIKDPIHLNQALYASVDDLLCNAIPANQTIHDGSSDTLLAWKTLPKTPTYAPAAAMLSGSLLAIGGFETPVKGGAVKDVYMYSPPTKSWIYISDLPAPRSKTAIAVLSSMEILVIGGWCGDRVNTVCKGTLHIKL